MSQIDELLRFLLDGKWHGYTEIVQKLNIDSQKLEKIVDLLREFDFVKRKGNMVQILPDTKKLVKSLKQKMEGQEINSTVFL